MKTFICTIEFKKDFEVYASDKSEAKELALEIARDEWYWGDLECNSIEEVKE